MHLAVCNLSVIMEAVIVEGPVTIGGKKKKGRSRDHAKKYYHLASKWRTEKHTAQV